MGDYLLPDTDTHTLAKVSCVVGTCVIDENVEVVVNGMRTGI